MKKRVFCSGILACLLFAVPLSAQELKRRFSVNPHVALYLPDGWQRVGGAELAMLQNAAKAAGMDMDLTSQISFRRPPGDLSISVHMIKVGRVAASDVDELLEKAEQGVAQVHGGDIEKKTAGMLQNAQVRDIYYDEDTKTVGLLQHIEVSGLGGMTSKSILFFTKGGLLQINFTAPDGQFAALESLSEQIAANGVKMEEGYAYDPIGSKLEAFVINLPFKAKVGLLVFVLALLGKAADLLVFAKSRRSPQPPARERARRPEAQAPAPPAAQHEKLRFPELSREDPLPAELQTILGDYGAIRCGTLFSPAADGDADKRFLLMIELADGLSLKEQQDSLRALNAAVASGGRIAKVIRQGAAQGARGLTVFERAPAAAAKPKKQPRADDGALPFEF